ncbi:hypothetical protein H010_03502 [Hydrogenophaga taeniospiralis CCUG 15921]|uniref:Uncharacterized protein n=1 Tax=Hydrogenophaga taeniospiralis CCUG 15921 TaxID=1281780 RepID=A0A9X4NQZ6_9BURK|nr:hypothetical protein [Hydrogenophaga taeniospiralis]MDG5974301.1 hypothetical protein [Hydrogenophaga taeniospiralis CCUG 15921]
MRHSRLLSTNATSQLGPQFAVLRLRSWPDLRHVSDRLTPDVIRICALLAIRPTGAPLIHRLLDMPRERAQHVVDMLYLHGHLSDGAPAAPLEKKEEAPAIAAPGVQAPKEVPPSVTGFLDRFRKKLLPAGAH